MSNEMVVFAFVVFAAFTAVVFGKTAVVIAGVIASATVLRTIKNMRRQRAAQQVVVALSTFYGAVTADLRAGASFPRAFARGAEALHDTQDIPSDLKQGLLTASVVARSGGDIVRIVQESSPHLAPLAALCTVSERHGIPLADVLEQAQAQLDARQRHRAATAASLQGPQATAVVLSLLPLAGVGMGVLMGAKPVSFLLNTSIGGWLLVAGVTLVSGGFIWSQHIISHASG
ncbi:MAG: type II secretion system F family protein [Corynebacterium sp.]|nr:type II secretion system F family protein [Corynebacterium sp.]